MIPLLILSLLSLAVIFERAGFWFRTFNRERDIVTRVLGTAPDDWAAAADLAKQASFHPIGRLFHNPLQLKDPDPELFRLALEATADDELAAMRRGDKILEAVIALAPLLGLLGTVTGLIKSLRSIRIGDLASGSAAGVTTGIGEALISTATGLIVAIMTLAFYRLFQAFFFGQVKLFRRSGNQLELLYRQRWLNQVNRRSQGETDESLLLPSEPEHSLEHDRSLESANSLSDHANASLPEQSVGDRDNLPEQP